MHVARPAPQGASGPDHIMRHICGIGEGARACKRLTMKQNFDSDCHVE